ncbi:MAG: hypothetical protein AB1468_06875, partial [Candidatus Micrarchaeota archaeon]
MIETGFGSFEDVVKPYYAGLASKPTAGLLAEMSKFGNKNYFTLEKLLGSENKKVRYGAAVAMALSQDNLPGVRIATLASIARDPKTELELVRVCVDAVAKLAETNKTAAEELVSLALNPRTSKRALEMMPANNYEMHVDLFKQAVSKLMNSEGAEQKTATRILQMFNGNFYTVADPKDPKLQGMVRGALKGEFAYPE